MPRALCTASPASAIRMLWLDRSAARRVRVIGGLASLARRSRDARRVAARLSRRRGLASLAHEAAPVAQRHAPQSRAAGGLPGRGGLPGEGSWRMAGARRVAGARGYAEARADPRHPVLASADVLARSEGEGRRSAGLPRRAPGARDAARLSMTRERSTRLVLSRAPAAGHASEARKPASRVKK